MIILIELYLMIKGNDTLRGDGNIVIFLISFFVTLIT